jgi:hypothetical protein
MASDAIFLRSREKPFGDEFAVGNQIHHSIPIAIGTPSRPDNYRDSIKFQLHHCITKRRSRKYGS